MKKCLSIIITFILLAGFYGELNCSYAAEPQKASILVVGTIHYWHHRNPNYSFKQLFQLIETFKPDVICVEIRPEDFRKIIYLDEMTGASIYGIKRNMKVYPIDWWEGDENHNARTMFEEYMKTDEYKVKSKLEADRVNSSEMIKLFENKYGDWDSNGMSKTQSYEFFNGNEYNSYIDERYKISMAIYGDHPANLMYETRNSRMMKLIEKATAENPGKRIIVLTGSEHKHYFDKAIVKNDKIILMQLKDILPLKECEPDKDVEVFLKDKRADYYLDTSTRKVSDEYFFDQIMPLMHGPDMDFIPKSIPKQNIEKAKTIIDEWRVKDQGSIGYSFELGWYLFLVGNYENAINNFEKVESNLIDFNVESLKFLVYRNISISYESLGNKVKADEWFLKGKKYAEQNNFSEKMIEVNYTEYKDLPERNKKH